VAPTKTSTMMMIERLLIAFPSVWVKLAQY